MTKKGSREAGSDILDGLSGVPGGITRLYIAPKAKVMFVSINKNACTSLKWMMADLAGEDLSTFVAGDAAFIEDSEAVHNRGLWKVSPKIDELTSEERAEINPQNGWFVFAVVRDPRLRFFSSWQNRMLIETPNWRRFHVESWYPRHPLTKETVVDDFAKFVNFLGSNPDHFLARDSHFRTQTALLAEDVIPYSRIYEIGEMEQLQKDLKKHLKKRGLSTKLNLKSANPTPLWAVNELFDNGVREKLEEIYADDFNRFNTLWKDFSKVENAKTWSEEDLATCEREAQLGKRIAELHEMLTRQKNSHISSRLRRIKNLSFERASSTLGKFRRNIESA